MYITENKILTSEESLNLGSDTIQLYSRLKLMQWEELLLISFRPELSIKIIIINYDSPAAIRAVENIKIKSKLLMRQCRP